LGSVESLPEPVVHAAASSIAELVSCAILTPAEVIKQNAQMVQTEKQPTSTARVNTTLETLKKFKRQPSALFQGYTALAGRNLPFTAIQFPLFEKLKTEIKQQRQRNGTWNGTLFEHSAITALSAGTAGSFAAYITTPVDVVKTRVMLEASEDRPRRGTLKAFGELYQEAGIRGLLRGGLLRSVWTMLGSGLYLGVYDFGRVYLAKRRGVDISDQDFF
jgi:solute carrier family 25 S-adenosylmethionine transporter 26